MLQQPGMDNIVENICQSKLRSVVSGTEKQLANRYMIYCILYYFNSLYLKSKSKTCSRKHFKTLSMFPNSIFKAFRKKPCFKVTSKQRILTIIIIVIIDNPIWYMPTFIIYNFPHLIILMSTAHHQLIPSVFQASRIAQECHGKRLTQGKLPAKSAMSSQGMIWKKTPSMVGWSGEFTGSQESLGFPISPFRFMLLLLKLQPRFMSQGCSFAVSQTRKMVEHVWKMYWNVKGKTQKSSPLPV